MSEKRIKQSQQGRPAVGQARALDAQRARRNAAAMHSPQVVEAPVFLTEDGRIGILLTGPLKTNADGELDVLVSDGLQVTAGSPKAIRLALSQGLEIDSQGKLRPKLSSSVRVEDVTGKLIARPTASEVAATASGTETDVQSWLNRLEAATVTIGKAEHYTRQFLLMGA